MNLVDESDLLALIDREDSAPVCSCKDKCEAGAVNTACAVCKTNMTECMGNVELAEAGQHERMQLAQALWYLKHDLSDEAREQGYLSCMDTLRGGGFPDETARLAERLTDYSFRDTLSGEFAQFYAAHEQDRSLLRFHYHKLENIWQSLRDLSLPRREYSSEMAAVPELGRFITEDEIDHALDRGSGVEGGKGRIYEYFTADHTGKERQLSSKMSMA